MNPLDLLPSRIAQKSISSQEVALPIAEALEAIDVFEAKGLLILGWEGWVKDQDGRVGHGSAPQGTTSLDRLSVAQAAQFCRDTIQVEAEKWHLAFPATTNLLYFCITVNDVA